ncbi:hypothetical protein BDZ90DRAFT_229051 [Jaminaea rosea]|uniref:SMAD/FHA domain-containing protein n=1 Tax=Jaminaea rosea TaxID=1569628 RepID=A0A316V1F1_9BASI|nr:hypothetical protein BDZ90DRAFT_229051 [Jaminaea rosea]PWN30013.1 hypothetical protein BDZ90DRAFT_229051 [Jaminaea rosea]
MSRATTSGFADARPVTSRSSSNLSSSANSPPAGIAAGFFERHNPFTSRGNHRPHTSTAGSNTAAGLDEQQPSSPRRRTTLRPGLGLGRFSSSSSQLPLDTNASNRPHFPSSPGAAAGSSTEELVSPIEPTMHSMTRTHSGTGNGNSNGAGGARDREGGSAFGRMFRRYSQGQHGVPRSSSNAALDSQSAVRASAVTSQLPSSSVPNNVRSTASSSSRDISTASGALPSQPAETNAIDGLPGAIAAQGLPALDVTSSSSAAAAPSSNGTNPSPQAGVHRIRLVPHLEATRSLHFEPIERDLREGIPAVKIGRFTDRTPAPAPGEDVHATMNAAAATSTQPFGSGPGNRGGAVPSSAGGGGRIDSARIAFKSKVVSRGHAELWCEAGGKFFIKDTKSSSGTFLNHIRLSAPNVESRPFAVKDGDILQLGVDYQGGTEEIYRCVKIRVELNRGWQREANQFNINALRQLRALQGSPLPTPAAAISSPAKPSDAAGVVAAAAAAAGSSLPTNRQQVNVTDCCICLFSVTVCQALFIAPCSHVFHYKCIRPLLNLHHPGFSCPLCRTFADLEADVEQDEEWQDALLKEAEAAEMNRLGAKGEGETPAVDRHTDGPPELLVSSSQGHGSGGGDGSAGASRTNSPSAANPDTTAVSGLPNTPSVPSGLRQQLQLDRPVTAVGDDGAQDLADAMDRTAVIRGAGAPAGAADESQEVMRDPMDEDENVASSLHGNATRLVSTSPRHSTIDEESVEPQRSLDTDVVDVAAGQGRRGSQPINIRSSSGATAASPNDLSGFSPLEEARTPVNQHVLSVLAEAPPPRSVAARRFAAQNADAGSTGSGSGGMPSLGASSSSLLHVPPSSSGGVGSATPLDHIADERRGSAVSEDVGFQTPGEGNSVDHSHSAAAGSFFPAHQQQQSTASPRGRTSGSGGSGGSGTGSGNGSLGSHQASPSTAGDAEVDREDEILSEPEGSSRRAVGGKAEKQRRERSTDSRASSIGGAASSGRGKMKMFLKKAAGA